jgi:hypothetical protein
MSDIPLGAKAQPITPFTEPQYTSTRSNIDLIRREASAASFETCIECGCMHVHPFPHSAAAANDHLEACQAEARATLAPPLQMDMACNARNT